MLLTCDNTYSESQKKWYAVYTKSRTEKVVYARLIDNNIHAYLPLQKTLRQWTDRKKWVETPLLSSYVFVHILKEEYDYVLRTDGVVKYISFEGRAVAIPSQQIDNLKLIIDSNAEVECTHVTFKEGQRVIVNVGPLQGLSGELVKTGRNKRFLVRIDHLDQNLLVNVPSSYLSKE